MLNLSPSAPEETHTLDSLIYPNNTTAIELSGCHVLVNETKSGYKVETQTIVAVVPINETVTEKVVIINKSSHKVNKHYEETDRPLPIVKYVCDDGLFIIEFTKLKQLNVSNMLLMIKEYVAPVPGNAIKFFSEEGDGIYVELINGSRRLTRETIAYIVNIEQGGYIVLEGDNVSVVKLIMVLRYFDGFVKQYGIEITRVGIKQICLDNGCATR